MEENVLEDGCCLLLFHICRSSTIKMFFAKIKQHLTNFIRKF